MAHCNTRTDEIFDRYFLPLLPPSSSFIGVNMCYTLGITAKDLATKLTRYSLNHDKDILGADDLRGLQKEVRLNSAPKKKVCAETLSRLSRSRPPPLLLRLWLSPCHCLTDPHVSVLLCSITMRR